MKFEYVKHMVRGKEVTFALDVNNKDWYIETIRNRPISNPVHHHLVKIITSKAFTGDLKYADFGANIGVSSYFAAAHGVQTLAIEAGRNNFTILQEGKRVNEFGSAFTPLFMAAAESEGTLSFFENSAWGAITQEKEGSYAIQTDTISNILKKNNFSDVQIIKVDIEGSELRAMTGFEDIIAEGNMPDIIMESNDTVCVLNGYSCQDLWSRMIELGYDVYLLKGSSLIPLTLAMAQDEQIADILATRRSPENLSKVLGYKITPYNPETTANRLSDLLIKAPEKFGIKEFVARQMKKLAEG